jgi:histone H3/H4
MAGENLVVVSKAKKYAKDQFGKRLSGEFMEALSDKVRALMAQANSNCEAGRQTLKARDLG